MCPIQEMKRRFLLMNEAEMYVVYLLIKHHPGATEAYQMAKYEKQNPGCKAALHRPTWR